VTELENNLNNLFKSIYKYENQRKFEFNEEISIEDTANVVMLTIKQLCRTKRKDGLIRPLLEISDKVYGMKYSQLQRRLMQLLNLQLVILILIFYFMTEKK